MKNSITGVLLILTSCASTNSDVAVELKENPAMHTFPQKWVLVKMSADRLGSETETTGKDMSWQEAYTLNEDKTFTKVREQDNTTTEARGTYAFVDLSDGPYVELTYTSDSEPIGNCTGDWKEYLRVTNENHLTGTWQACDGPGLEYQLAGSK